MDSFTRDPHAPLRLLSLDGGGVRGLSSLLVLRDLMYAIAAEEKRLGRREGADFTALRPCDYFDLIGGTSTGGIIAILLSRLKLDCEQCIKIYLKMAEKIFKHDRSISVFGMKIPTGSSRFSGTVLADAIKSSLKELGFDEDEPMWDEELFKQVDDYQMQSNSIWQDAIFESPVASTVLSKKDRTSSSDTDAGLTSTLTSAPSRAATWQLHKRDSVYQKENVVGCRGLVLTSLKNALGLPRILSTYDPNDQTTRIWEALRATSAAPTFFEEMQFGSPKVTYLDGGVGFNNPCAEVDYAAKSLWENRFIGVIVSIGTGLQSLTSVRKGASWLPFGLGSDIALATALASMATSTARVDNEMERMYHYTDTKYYRFDVDRGLSNISLEQWMKEDEMASLTEQYMQDGEQVRRTKELAEIMAKLSALPPKFEIPATAFRLGVDGKGLKDGNFRLVQVDFKTGRLLATNKEEVPSTTPLPQFYKPSTSGPGALHSVHPVTQDLDRDGSKDEAAVHQCLGASNVCIRAVKTGIPPGHYKAQFILAFHSSMHTPPHDLIVSVGRPFDVTTFESRFVDVKITPDCAAVLLQPDAVRVRVGEERYQENCGKGWVEIDGDVDVKVGLDGELGFIISKRFEEGVVVDGFSFGGVRLEPVVRS
jgi:predicted acylesterase/phospholipase RssA